MLVAGAMACEEADRSATRGSRRGISRWALIDIGAGNVCVGDDRSEKCLAVFSGGDYTYTVMWKVFGEEGEVDVTPRSSTSCPPRPINVRHAEGVHAGPSVRATGSISLYQIHGDRLIICTGMYTPLTGQLSYKHHDACTWRWRKREKPCPPTT
jgi:hypothetical protein